MTGTKEERAAAKAQFRQLPASKKLEHIYIYYKWPILITLVTLVLVGGTVWRKFTAKTPVLTMALVNVEPGPEAETLMTADFLAGQGMDPGRQEISLLRGLYLAEDAEADAHRLVYASRIKLMGAVEQQQLDLVLMSRQAYDLISAQGWLLELEPLVRDGTYLAENQVVLEDNGIEYQLGEAQTHEVVTAPAVNALDLSALPGYDRLGLDDGAYLGVLSNTPRQGLCAAYLEYLIRTLQ